MVYEVIESKFGSPRSVTVYAEENQPAVTGKYQIVKLVFLYADSRWLKTRNILAIQLCRIFSGVGE